MSADPANPLLAKIDLHGYRPADFIGLPMMTIVQQAWEMGAARLRFVHGHGRARGKSPGFYNTHTGYFGLRIRRELRHNRGLRQWIKYTTLDCGDWGTSTVGLKANPAPTRSALDLTVLPATELSGRKARPVMWSRFASFADIASPRREAKKTPRRPSQRGEVHI